MLFIGVYDYIQLFREYYWMWTLAFVVSIAILWHCKLETGRFGLILMVL